jgi:hypothetical protein
MPGNSTTRESGNGDARPSARFAAERICTRKRLAELEEILDRTLAMRRDLSRRRDNGGQKVRP